MRATATDSRHKTQRKIGKAARVTYDGFADDYDLHLRRECEYRSPERLAAVVLAGGASGRWLDLGAGTGLLGEALIRRGACPELVGLDISAAMLERVSCPLYRERHRCDVLRRIPGSERFDGAMAVGLLEYVLDVPALMERVAARLHPNGRFVFAFCPAPASKGDVVAFDLESDLHAHNPAHIRACLRAAGFRGIQIGARYKAYLNGEQGWVAHRIVRATLGPPTGS